MSTPKPGSVSCLNPYPFDLTDHVNKDPKHVQGIKKPHIGLLPRSFAEGVANALQSGGIKYGYWNWRESKIDLPDYIDAIGRHYIAFANGETHDPESGEPHIFHIAATCAIIADAEEHGQLINTRPSLPTGHDNEPVNETTDS